MGEGKDKETLPIGGNPRTPHGAAIYIILSEDPYTHHAHSILLLLTPEDGINHHTSIMPSRAQIIRAPPAVMTPRGPPG